MDQHPSALCQSLMVEQFVENGFTTLPFPESLRASMLKHIDSYVRELGAPYYPKAAARASLEELAAGIPDEIWSRTMARAFRMFPDDLAQKLRNWADNAIRKGFEKSRSAISVVSAEEIGINPKLSNDSLAIYWRCVRPGKPDAGRPHRDATFWILEFESGYDPKIPFPFDKVKDSVKLWIPLRGCIPSTTLQIIPRSHRMDLMTVIEDTEYGRRPNIESKWLEKHERDFMSPIELSRGSCIIFDMNLVHRGPTHNNKELRISAELTLVMQ